MRRLVLLLAVIAAPVAQASAEGFSHEVRIVGRVVDADGAPVAGVTIAVALHGATSLGGCLFGAHSDATDANGDFVLCRHVHALPENATAALTVEGASVDVPIDARLRLGVARLQLNGTHAGGAIPASVRVAGRIVFAHPGGERIEGVNVTATPLSGLPVTLRLDAGPRVLATANATTDENGDYAADLPWAANATVTLEASGRVSTASVDAWRRVDLDQVHVAAPPPPARPGTGTPRIPGPEVALVFAAIALSACARWRSRPT
ncbi:MAG: hypothetical protein QOE90_2279 [Thermoplasmata archaeon]|jgi:hypothetical protein|nr:hypothetical protein [Thermoplasmata archaeon]